jgi:hypothetical protein
LGLWEEWEPIQKSERIWPNSIPVDGTNWSIAEFERRRAAAHLGGREKRIAAQYSTGKLTARERLELLLH